MLTGKCKYVMLAAEKIKMAIHVIEKGRNEELQALFYSIQGGIWDICNLKSMCIDCETERMFQLGGGSV